jgi:phosphatidylserine decarboxylase
MWRIVPKRAVSGAISWGVSLGIPAPLRTLMLSRFARIYGIDVSEAEKPISEYAGFDEFFTRKLRPGARPIDGCLDASFRPPTAPSSSAGWRPRAN